MISEELKKLYVDSTPLTIGFFSCIGDGYLSKTNINNINIKTKIISKIAHTLRQKLSPFYGVHENKVIRLK
jgi:hypothetical protein